ncbi:hypothetical protein K443DRAFT_4705 [Laccaria amethystina LaAM-08-1]|uniref:HAT C-terminal dimerisation domain-containing protein n=1 Tax=Laccaria amethystina LaAM-08-1 TaxID=1095629 RepID=A0A0C9Y8R4_9AGAR|nr:hypothetical protein K443DRAFT_4705 [Laccaria amethystina LaAM-08-1]
MQRDMTKDTDLVEWWQDHAQLFPMLACITLNVFPAQASSVPCEQLFSGTKQIVTDRHALLVPSFSRKS